MRLSCQSERSRNRIGQLLHETDMSHMLPLQRDWDGRDPFIDPSGRTTHFVEQHRQHQGLEMPGPPMPKPQPYEFMPLGTAPDYVSQVPMPASGPRADHYAGRAYSGEEDIFFLK